MYTDLLNDAKKQLAGAIVHKKHPFRYFTLTTVGKEGSPHSRTVVLRGVESDPFTIKVYTDTRSAKVQQLIQDPRAALLFYDSSQLLQLSIKAQLLSATDAESTFAAMTEPMKKDYSSTLAPGTPIEGPDQVTYNFNQGYFTILTFEVISLEYLKLKRPNHLRIRFSAEENWKGVFLTP